MGSASGAHDAFRGRKNHWASQSSRGRSGTSTSEMESKPRTPFTTLRDALAALIGYPSTLEQGLVPRRLDGRAS